MVRFEWTISAAEESPLNSAVVMKILLQWYKQLISYDTANTLKIGDFLCSDGRFSQARSQLYFHGRDIFLVRERC